MVGFRTKVGAALAATGLVVVGAATAPASAGSGGGYPGGGSDVKVITKGLDGPFGLAKLGPGFVVAESVSGEVTKISKYGGQHVLVSGAPGVAGVASGWGRVFSVLGGPNEDGAPPAGKYKPSSVLRTNVWSHRTVPIADLLDWELKHNPDGQVQFVDGKPVDALSNPFAMTSYWGGLLVADGGANDVIKVNPWTGRRSTFFVPPTVKDVPGCQNANPGTVGCDPVPTGVVVKGGSVYVSTLGAEVPGAGRIYKLNVHNGKVQRIWKGLTSPTGVAVGSDGSIYFSAGARRCAVRRRSAAGRLQPRGRRSDHQDRAQREADPRAGDHADRSADGPRHALLHCLEHRVVPGDRARRTGGQGREGRLPLSR